MSFEDVIREFQRRTKAIEDKSKENVKISSKISNLNPYLDKNAIIKVGGRLEKSDISNDCKLPILIPKGCHFSKLIIYGFII